MRILFKDGTGSVSLKYLMEDSDRHGNTRLYVRVRGRKKRLRALVGSDEFMTEYKAAIFGLRVPVEVQARVSPQSLKWLVTKYQASAEFSRLDIETQANRRRILDEIVAKHADKRFKILRRKHVKALRDEKSTTPHAANNRLKVMKYLFTWAVDEELMDENPARDVKAIQADTEGFHTWTIEELLKFMERHPADTKAGLAFALLYYLGPRRCDVVKLGPQMVSSDGFLRLIETKGHRRKQKVTELTVGPELLAVLDLHPTKHLTYLTTAHGKPFAIKGFGNWFKARCLEAGLTLCTAHGLRKAGATIASDRGATTEQLMSMYGWTNPSQAHHYTKKANRKRLAGETSRLLSLGDQKSNAAVPQKMRVEK